jgi:ATP-binding cassette subfamily F protein uup
MILVNCHNLEKSFATKTLFKNVGFGIEDREHVGLVGPNGAGKSTLLKILAGLTDLDGGQVTKKKGLRLGFLEQTPQFQKDDTIMSALISKALNPDDAYAKAYELMGRLELFQFGEDFLVSDLSGGWKKRVALARELIIEPELLLLDEPTNHLDVTSILWLEEYLAQAQFSTLMVTHDRLFLQRVAQRILDLDPRNPNYLLSVNGDYLTYLEAKEHELHAQQRHEKVLKNTLRRETEWLRRGAKARQTKQKARIEAAADLADTVNDLSNKNRHKTVGLDFGEVDKSPKKLIELKDVAKSYGEKVLFKDLNLTISPKTRLALLGQNGSGKSTLIRILLGLEKPDHGTSMIGSTASSSADEIKISYFEQGRESLDPNLSVFKNVCPHGDFVNFQGQPIHARSYLDRFLFRGSKVDLPVAKLSGGEQARLRIAQLMLREAHVLVLDEPTNDLDSDTLDVLEQSLAEFKGGVILVTHDRYFMDAVANQILAFPPEGFTGEGALEHHLLTFANYLQWEEWFVRESQKSPEDRRNENEASTSETKAKGDDGKKLSYKEKFELENIEGKIHELEKKLEALNAESSKISTSDHAALTEAHREMGRLQSEIDTAYARWSDLEKRSKL